MKLFPLKMKMKNLLYHLNAFQEKKNKKVCFYKNYTEMKMKLNK